jgi:MFS family permease
MSLLFSVLNKHKFFYTYLLGFLYTLHGALPVYIGSQYLERYIDGKYVGLVYTLAFCLTIVVFYFSPRILSRMGNYRFTMWLGFVELSALVVLIVANNPFVALAGFVVSVLAVALTNFTIDLFLENQSSGDNSHIGDVRGIFLSTANFGWVLSQPLVGWILTDGDFWKVYLAAAVVLLPVLWLLHRNFKEVKDPVYVDIKPKEALAALKRDSNVSNILICTFFMQLFFSWMVIYSPLLLVDVFGFDQREISMIIFAAMLPFVFFEAPLGKLADEYLGEKELLVLGFIIMAGATGLILSLGPRQFWLTLIVFVLTRVGASMVEIMTDTYFFKRIKNHDLGLMSMFRTIRPWAYIVGSLLGTVLLQFVGIQTLFAMLAVLMLGAVPFALAIEDTR